jgi:hypothetical protein
MLQQPAAPVSTQYGPFALRLLDSANPETQVETYLTHLDHQLDAFKKVCAGEKVITAVLETTKDEQVREWACRAIVSIASSDEG